MCIYTSEGWYAGISSHDILPYNIGIVSLSLNSKSFSVVITTRLPGLENIAGMYALYISIPSYFQLEKYFFNWFCFSFASWLDVCAYDLFIECRILIIFFFQLNPIDNNKTTSPFNFAFPLPPDFCVYDLLIECIYFSF